jgi:hypothetical protein
LILLDFSGGRAAFAERFHEVLDKVGELAGTELGELVLLDLGLDSLFGFLDRLQPFDGDLDGEMRFRITLHDAPDSVELLAEDFEDSVEIACFELGSEAVHGLLVSDFVHSVTDEAHVVAAKLFGFEGGSAAGFSGRKIVSAEAGWIGHGALQ